MSFEFILEHNNQQRHQYLWRHRKVVSSENCRYLIHDNQRYLNFSSNDYLAMASEPQVAQVTKEAIDRYGVSSRGSALICGYSPAHAQLERQLCSWLGFEACLLFNSGFAANSALLHCLMADKQRFILADKLVHASLISAGTQVQANMKRFLHNDINSLQSRLDQCSGDTLVISEGVFSMDGDTCPLPAISDISRAKSAWLMVDDAHGIGVNGEQGRGSVTDPKWVDIHMVTFGKAIGTSGAAIGGCRALIDHMIQFCKHYTYSTSMPPAIAAATNKSINLLTTDYGDERRAKLKALIAHFTRCAKQLGIQSNSDSAIQPIIIGDPEKALSISEHIKKQGIWLNAIRPPTVPHNTSRLRVTLTSAHEIADIDLLFDSLERYL